MKSAGLPELDWNEISEPGCYLLTASGLLARVHPEDLVLDRDETGARTAGRVVMLSDNPRTPLGSLREIAHRANYLVAF